MLSLELAVIYFMTPKGHIDLWPWPKGKAFDLAGDHKYPGNTIMR